MKNYKKAIKGKSFIGLDGNICEKPKYWCRLHQVYLSEGDVIKKHCKCKYSFDMISAEMRGDLEKLRGGENGR